MSPQVLRVTPPTSAWLANKMPPSKNIGLLTYVNDKNWVWWHTPVISALRETETEELWVWGQLGLHSQRPCLKETIKKKEKEKTQATVWSKCVDKCVYRYGCRWSQRMSWWLSGHRWHEDNGLVPCDPSPITLHFLIHQNCSFIFIWNILLLGKIKAWIVRRQHLLMFIGVVVFYNFKLKKNCCEE
jgi:hypothetical protein